MLWSNCSGSPLTLRQRVYPMAGADVDEAADTARMPQAALAVKR